MKIIFCLLVFPLSVFSGKVQRLAIKTSDDTPHDNDFQTGATDVFEGDAIGGCLNFEIGSDEIGVVFTIRHEGSGGWKGEWAKIILEDGKEFTCDLNIMMDNSMEKDFLCADLKLVN